MWDWYRSSVFIKQFSILDRESLQMGNLVESATDGTWGVSLSRMVLLVVGFVVVWGVFFFELGIRPELHTWYSTTGLRPWAWLLVFIFLKIPSHPHPSVLEKNLLNRC